MLTISPTNALISGRVISHHNLNKECHQGGTLPRETVAYSFMVSMMYLHTESVKKSSTYCSGGCTARQWDVQARHSMKG